ncbi:hypothetical protein KBTX_02886 [wastewater metagenome]|uniref:Uncharacterized protein n=2 Tax=unclassified sequences TaxID=12908 RepID=A0A5B8RD72_9ZZZZ|nr:hypothetical protein KBTEX_02886 [uncultured organism]
MDFLHAHGVLHGIVVPLHGVARLFQALGGAPPELEGQDRVLTAVGHEHRGVRVGRRRLREALAQGQVGGQAHDAGKPLRMVERGVQGHGAALGEAREHQPLRGDTAPGLPLDQRGDRRAAALQAIGVLVHGLVEAVEVVPGTHGHAGIQRDRAHRCVGEDEPHPCVTGQPQLRDDGLEVMAIGPQPVQPDHGGIRVLAGTGLDRLQQFLAHLDPPHTFAAGILLGTPRSHVRRRVAPVNSAGHHRYNAVFSQEVP